MVVGVHSSTLNMTQFLGIPYATPPLGELRWKVIIHNSCELTLRDQQAPSPPLYQKMVYAQQLPKGCIQANVSLDEISEDCLYVVGDLYLNIYVPDTASDKSRVPVKFFIPGGEFIVGSGSLYDGSNLAQLTDSIVVTINYRLNIFGFYVLPAMYAENPVLNYGIQDQLAALKWVHDNIKYFGGNESNVLLFGQSAGGQSVNFHLYYKESAGLFHKAIMESPAPWNFPACDVTALTNLLTVPMNCSSTNGSSASELECLRNIEDPIALLYSMNNTWQEPCVDGISVAYPAYQLWLHPPVSNVPLLFGSNSYEGNLFTYEYTQTLNLTEAFYDNTYESIIPTLLPIPEEAQMVKMMYAPIAETEGYFLAISDMLGDLYINCGTETIAKGVLTWNIPAYVYFFQENTKHWEFAILNATHQAELPYVFANGIYNTTFNAAEQTLCTTIVSYWHQFHLSGDPNSENQPLWPQYYYNQTASFAIPLIQSLLAGEVQPMFPPEVSTCSYWQKHTFM